MNRTTREHLLSAIRQLTLARLGAGTPAAQIQALYCQPAVGSWAGYQAVEMTKPLPTILAMADSPEELATALRQLAGEPTPEVLALYERGTGRYIGPPR